MTDDIRGVFDCVSSMVAKLREPLLRVLIHGTLPELDLAVTS